MMNWLLFFLLIAQNTLNISAVIAAIIFENPFRVERTGNIWYLPHYAGDILNGPYLFWLKSYFSFLIVLEVMIPMSLFVTLEFVKAIQAKIMEKRIVAPDGTHMKAKTSNLNFDLALIDIVFSDKTGTLTENIMEYSGCFARSADDFCYFAKDEKLKYDSSENMRLYLQNILLNNSVTVVSGAEEDEEPNDSKKTKVCGPSSDEVCLVNELAGDAAGVYIISRTKERVVLSTLEGEEEEFDILLSFAFSSERKRMSYVVRNKASGKILVMAKGADSEMFKRCVENTDERQPFEEAVLRFSNNGYRTLVMGYKELSEEDYEIMKKKHDVAQRNLEKGRKRATAELAEDFETGFILLAVTAIEDDLQDGVTETVDFLRAAKVQVWVLTGDKTVFVYFFVGHF